MPWDPLKEVFSVGVIGKDHQDLLIGRFVLDRKADRDNSANTDCRSFIGTQVPVN